MACITQKERLYLRELAKKQREYASLPEMEEKEKAWFDLNMGRPAVPPVVVETWTFGQDMMPEGILRCTSPKAREMEYRLLKQIREYELIHDDKVVPKEYPVDYRVEIDEFGIPVEERHAVDAQGRSVGYEYHSPIRDLEEDFHLLKPAALEIDRRGTQEEAQLAEEVLGDILPVTLRGIPPIIAMPWQASRLLGLEGMMLSMYDCPKAMHMLMAYLTENQIRIMEAYEREGILTLNNRNQETGMSSYGFTEELPRGREEGIRQAAFRKEEGSGRAVFSKEEGGNCLGDIWLWAEAEETASISPEMFREFFLPYMARACSRVGLIYYGCCEPMERNWPGLVQAIPNIRKVSVSPFSNQEQMGEMLRGTGIVFSRKPLANYLSIAGSFDEDAWTDHIRETLQAARGCQCEIIMRDIYQVGNLGKVRRAVELAKGLALQFTA